MSIPTYEYKVREAERHSDSAHELQEELDTLGKQGWLLITEHEEKLIFVRPVVPPPPPPSTNQAVTGTVSVAATDPEQGDSTMGQLTVDSAGNAKYQFDDDHGDLAAVPQGDGSGIVVTFASDTPSVASLANPVGVAGVDANGYAEYLAPLTFGVDGTFNLSAVVSNESGADLVDDDGSTPFAQAASVAVPVAAGQATTGTVSEDGD